MDKQDRKIGRGQRSAYEPKMDMKIVTRYEARVIIVHCGLTVMKHHESNTWVVSILCLFGLDSLGRLGESLNNIPPLAGESQLFGGGDFQVAEKAGDVGRLGNRDVDADVAMD